jgi:ABC-type nitrate/sulfonate/bicarbonate transport system permease component
VSSEAAGKGFWWTAGATIALAAIGLFLAPAIGIILILAAQSIPLADVNLITSVIHVALVPFVAIAFALIYFELRERE